MPYKRIGRVIYHKKGGRWRVKQVCRTVENAKAALRLLQALEHGWTPERQQARRAALRRELRRR